MGHQAAETDCNINNTFGPGIANEHTVQWWFKKFNKEEKSLEEEDKEADNHQLRAIIEADPLTTTWEVSKELNIDHFTVILYFEQIG